MKKIMTALTFSLTAILGSTQIVNAAPHSEESKSFEHERNRHDRSTFRGSSDNAFDKRKMREERGVNRLKQHRWQTGYVMPQHYRGNAYKIDYKQNNLSKPAGHQQWYKINNDYILVDLNSNSIIQIRED